MAITDTDTGKSSEGGFARAWFPLGDGTWHDDPYYAAAMRGDGIHKHAETNPTDTSGNEVLVTTDIYYNLDAGEKILITAFSYGLGTPSDTMSVQMVKTDSDAGGGTDITALGVTTAHVTTGATPTGKLIFWNSFNPPLLVANSDGWESVSVRIVSVTDSSADIHMAWTGLTVSS